MRSSATASQPPPRPARTGSQRKRSAQLPETGAGNPVEAVDKQLARYRAMRDFNATTEPAGALPNQSHAGRLPFVVQKHAATRLHYDFRLGWRGVLKSWAVAKGPSYHTHDRRLAVEVEDHPIEYGGFEGTIPKGQYGGGTVLLWDQGAWEPLGDVDEGLAQGRLKFTLHGEKLRGHWTLIRMVDKAAASGTDHGSRSSSKPNWLLIKEHDEFEQTADAEPITDSAPKSVITGRSLEQIAADHDHTWNSDRSKARTANHSGLARHRWKSAGKNNSKHFDGAPEEAFPDFLPPQLATAAPRPPTHGDWLYELKLDGYRMQAHVQRCPSVSESGVPGEPARWGGESGVPGEPDRRGGDVTLYTRSGLDWTRRMPAVAEAVAALPVEAAILDGEVVVLDEHGRTSFGDLQAALDASSPHPLTYFAFDLWHLNGHNLRGLPLRQRKSLLERILAEQTQPNPTLCYTQQIETDGEGEGNGAAIFSQACGLGAEGIIAKSADSRYFGGRSESWLKLKCVRRQEFVIGGFTLPGDGGAGIGSLLLGYYANGKLLHCGRTGTGFSQPTRRMLRAKLEALRIPQSAFSSKLTALARKHAIWVKPELVCEVEFATWTGDGLIRHASFHGLREDKAPQHVVREDMGPSMKAHRRKASLPGRRRKDTSVNPDDTEPAIFAQANPTMPAVFTKTNKAMRSIRAEHLQESMSSSSEVLETRITHPDKILDAETGVTKQQLALYYQAVAPAMLPHIEDRPVSIVRCPEGALKQCFFQKHAGVGLPKALGKVAVPDKKTGRSEDYITINSAEALVSLAQVGGLEIHPWGSRNGSLEAPDRLIFDLDPDEALPWTTLAASARSIRDLLKELKLESFVKSTGGKGLHIVVPIQPKTKWPEIKQFCRGIAAAIESTDPSLYLIRMTKAARKGRIFVDYLRNERGATGVAPYSPRARAGLRVAVPLAWEELDQGMPTFSVANFDTWRDRLQHNPWASLPRLKQSIRPAVLSAVLETSKA